MRVGHADRIFIHWNRSLQENDILSSSSIVSFRCWDFPSFFVHLSMCSPLYCLWVWENRKTTVTDMLKNLATQSSYREKSSQFRCDVQSLTIRLWMSWVRRKVMMEEETDVSWLMTDGWCVAEKERGKWWCDGVMMIMVDSQSHKKVQVHRDSTSKVLFEMERITRKSGQKKAFFLFLHKKKNYILLLQFYLNPKSNSKCIIITRTVATTRGRRCEVIRNIFSWHSQCPSKKDRLGCHHLSLSDHVSVYVERRKEVMTSEERKPPIWMSVQVYFPKSRKERGIIIIITVFPYWSLAPFFLPS